MLAPVTGFVYEIACAGRSKPQSVTLSLSFVIGMRLTTPLLALVVTMPPAPVAKLTALPHTSDRAASYLPLGLTRVSSPIPRLAMATRIPSWVALMRIAWTEK